MSTSSNYESYRNLVVEELETNGLIGQLKSKLKSSVIEVIKKQKKDVRQKLDFEFLTSFQKQAKKSKELMLLSHLILEFLQFYELEYTMPIYQNETNIKEFVKKETLVKDTFISKNYDKDQPILLQIFNNYLSDKSREKNREGGMGGYGGNFERDREVSTSGLGLFSGGLGNSTKSMNSYLLKDEDSSPIKQEAPAPKKQKLAPLSFGSDNTNNNSSKLNIYLSR